MSGGLSRAYLEETVDSVLSTPGALDGAMHPSFWLTPEGRAQTVHAKVHQHEHPQTDCGAVHAIASAIKEAVEAERKHAQELVDRATGFAFDEGKVVIAARLDSPGKERGVHWVIHQTGNPKRILNPYPWPRWERETSKLLRDPDYIARTRMHFDIAFRSVNYMIKNRTLETSRD